MSWVDDVERSYIEPASWMIKMSSEFGKSIEDRVRYFFPVFSLWQEMKQKHINGKMAGLDEAEKERAKNELYLRIIYQFERMRIAEKPEARPLAQTIARLAVDGDFRLLDAIWEAIHDQRLVEKVLNETA